MVRIGTAAWLLVFVLGHSPHEAKAQEGVPAYRDGEFWAYETTEKRSAEADRTSGFAGTYNVKVLAGGKLEIASAFADVFPSVYDSSSGVEWFKFPYKVGDTWKVRYLSDRGKWRYGKVTVVGKENITVPAGTFDVYKFVMNEDPGKKNDIEYWYSPKIKAVVRAVQKRYRREELTVMREAVLSSYSIR